jgi:hypothetical protein
MAEVIDIRGKLPPPKFKPMLVPSERVEAYESAPVEVQIADQVEIIATHALLLIKLCLGVERMREEVLQAIIIAEKRNKSPA